MNSTSKTPKTKKPSAITSEFVPPHDIELEKIVLGAIMLEKEAFATVSQFLKSECFYSAEHQKIYSSFYSLALKNVPIDLMTVFNELNQQGVLEQVGGASFLAGLQKHVASTANLETHARILFEKFLLRELSNVGLQLHIESGEGSSEVQGIIDQVQTRLFSLTKGLYKKDFQQMELVTMQALNDIEEKSQREPGTITGVPSGFKDLDECTGGFQDSDFIILAARPAVGKTALALRIARNAATHAKQPVGVALFSLEMATGQLVNRILSAESEILLEKIRDSDLNDIEKRALYKTADKVSTFPIYIDDSPNLNIIELKGKIKRLVSATNKNTKVLKLKKGIGLIIIDYLQLMNGVNDGTHKNKQEIVGEISRQLKILAKELQVPIIALSQMSRAVETRENKEPNLSDLRESGAIEQDADIVAFLYNEGGETKLRIAKHRNGKLKRLKLTAKLEIQQFYNYTAAPFSPKQTSTSGNFDDGIETAEEEFLFSKNKK